MSEREEEGIAGMSVAKSRFGAPIWHSGGGKKDRKGRICGSEGEPGGETGLCHARRSQASALAETIGIVHDHFVYRFAGRAGEAQGSRSAIWSPQREYIEHEAARRGLTNLRVVTSDINTFDPQVQFDRIVSVEVFEHIMNWRELLSRLKSWLSPDGRVLMHIFTHRSGAYRFDRTDREDGIAQHFFSGGVMPSHHLIRQYADLFAVEKEWRWSGTHYQRTAQDWLANFDARHDAIEAILREIHGEDTALWMRRWRWSFLATAGQFGYADGSEWGISHYRLKMA
jgi:cyclopropane fatty-acyl-phospholipid synthase-like methyltransferase